MSANIQSQNVDAALTALTAIIKEVCAKPKPTYSIDGQSVDWSSYLQMLVSQLQALMRARQDLAGSFQRITKTRLF